MVDPIGPKGSTPNDLRVAPVTPVVAAPKAAPVVVADEPQLSPATQLASQLATQPPVDTERVSRIKQAIANGTFPILPATIADRMLALRYDWMSDDAA
jgi:negative regulator of flagellin synthesis FlgM